MGEILDVFCMAFPDGTSRWLDVAEGEDMHARLGAEVSAWKAALPPERVDLMRGGEVFGGVVRVAMFRADFEAIPAAQRVIRSRGH